jgi:hypothetical protein
MSWIINWRRRTLRSEATIALHGRAQGAHAHPHLSDDVLNDVDQHCPLVALPSDVARAGLEPRAAYTAIVRRMLAVFRGAFPQHDPSADDKAQVILNLCVGGMLIARTTDDLELRGSLRKAALDQALRLLGSPSGVSPQPDKPHRRSS